MTEELYRICPTCGKTNAPDADFCTSCNAFIAMVSPSALPQEESSISDVAVEHAAKEILCPGCEMPVELGLIGDDGKYLCSSCGQLLEIDAPQKGLPSVSIETPKGSSSGYSQDEVSSHKHVYGSTTIERNPILKIGQNTYVLKENDVLGREGTVAVGCFEPFDAVSRQHVLIVREQGSWGLRVPARVQNQTSLDGSELPREQFIPFSGTHQLQLSTQCSVQIGLG